MPVHEDLLHRHVRESNLIENIIVQPGEPLYDGHFLAARAAARGDIVHPNKLHTLLACRIPELKEYAGKYRTSGVMVGGVIMPNWRNVPMLMKQWSALVRQYKSTSETKNLGEFAHLLHVWLLCIHPYIDGNGRTARLVWNMLRVNKGLSWHVEPAKTKHSYYARIRSFEIEIFQKEYPEVYS